MTPEDGKRERENEAAGMEDTARPGKAAERASTEVHQLPQVVVGLISDDWVRGMRAEAEYAPDPAWAREVRLNARRTSISRGLGLGIAVFGVLAALQIGLLTVNGLNKPLHLSWMVVLGAVASAGIFLNRVGISAKHVVLGVLLYVPLAWACLVMAQWLWADFAPQTPQPVVALGVGLPVLALNALGAVKIWRSGKDRLA